MAMLLVQAAVTFALGAVYRALLPDTVVEQEGARLQDAKITSAAEGTAVNRLWGRHRLGGQVIWATKFKEVVEVDEQTQSGGKGSGPSQTTKTTTYRYFQSFAIGLCEGNGGRVRLGRIWADGKEVDQSKSVIRFHEGTETQGADSLIQAIEGDAPAFRGLAYVVFEDFEVTPYGNRIPQITIEVSRSLDDDPDRIEQKLKAVTMIPGSNEFIYGTRNYFTGSGEESKSENLHQSVGEVDFLVSLDQLEDDAPNVDSVELVVAWFGSDLRCGSCTVKPKVDVKNKTVKPVDWRVATLDRAAADVVTNQQDGTVAYGGTPSDVTVREAITEMKSRGMRVVFYPFLMMDIPAGNTLNDPWSSATSQPVYPWRGRITCDPAPGQPGTPDKTGTAATQVSNFVGTVSRTHFSSWNGTVIPYSGPNEWTFRRMILHYAWLCKDLLGSGDAFIVGTEMRGMTNVRSSSSNFPFVNALADLIDDVRLILPAGVKISYAADWSEYHSYRPSDGSNDVYFNLDKVWDKADFIGIDNYLPITDWRTTDDYDYRLDTLMEGIEGGEYYDYYYASDADRRAGIQTPIVDSAYSKHWVFRQKDFKNWWLSNHYNRPGGTESGSPTVWTPQSKPIWFTEYGCAAIDKGANQPNVFLDPKSSESFRPYFSTGARDDLIQRRYAEAWIKYWDANSPSGMLSSQNMFAWTWDARPFPTFPYGDWGDRDNWRLGHWLGGRLNVMFLKDLVRDLGGEVGLVDSDFDFTGLNRFPVLIRGHLSNQVETPRAIIEQLMTAFHVHGFESQGKLRFRRKRLPDEGTFTVGELVSRDKNPGGYEITTAQETEIPREITVTFADEALAFQAATATGKRQTGNSQLVETIRVATVLEPDEGRNIAEELMQERWIGRQVFKGAFGRDLLRYDPGDSITIEIKGRPFTFRIDELTIGMDVEMQGSRVDKSIYTQRSVISSLPTQNSGVFQPGGSLFKFIDIPLLDNNGSLPHAPRIVAHQRPWPGEVLLYEEDGSGGYFVNSRLTSPGLVGETTAVLKKGPLWRWDRGNTLRVKWFQPTTQIMSLSELSVLNGANVLAVETSAGWELIQFTTATLVGTDEYELTGLLRGQNGTEYAMVNSLAAGATVVFATAAWGALNMRQDEIGVQKSFRFGPVNVPVSDARYDDVDYTPTGRSMMPFSPVHLKQRLSGSDLILSWIRRSRLNADSWDGTVPLNEDTEKYQVDILNGSTVERTIQVDAATEVTYTAAQQTADFGSTQTSVDFRVYQMSAVVGRGEKGTL